MSKTISIVIPCFNEQESIFLFYDAVEKVKPSLRGYDIEYVFVNDGSKDQTLNILRKLHQKDEKSIHYLSFSRNFGKEAALYAGLQASKGDYVAVMDVDLQDPPAQLIPMLEGIEDEGYDIVGTRRMNRKGEPMIRSFFSQLFYKMINKISHTQFLNGVRDFRLMTRQVVNAVLQMSEYNRFSKGLFSWVGFDVKYLEYSNRDRIAGKTSWSFWGLFKYSIEGIVNFSEMPLAIASYTGLVSFIISLVSILFIILRKIFFGGSVNGWASMISVILLIGGIQLFCLGILGRYIGNLYLEAKRRPIYIIKEKN
ncbi:glycosyltransferase family 2 protein [Ligilactobacillus acidipiscis]|uniref:glycosyltransferase family 2 protein n=1 Tax=Ligilactobacillus acidipiscis TaxID=89059 RepID=UPI0023F93F60|nr:glycosyltransferase family 2 protein [Ligilactobacillus acidipiscis]WEV56591.1 glycosyltransferase family 2 protein [Ligilactobacillus acidipiscis]